MAGHHNRYGIIMVGHAYGSESARLSYGTGDVGVGAGLAIGDAQQRLPAAPLKVCAAQVQLKAELAPATGEIFFQFADVRAQFTYGFLPFGVGKMSVLARQRTTIELQQCQTALRGCEQ